MTKSRISRGSSGHTPETVSGVLEAAQPLITEPGRFPKAETDGEASTSLTGASPGKNRGAAAKPHYHGHRERLRERFRNAGSAALADYELVELLLFRAIPRGDMKPLAKALVDHFGSFAEVIAAHPDRLAEFKGVGDAVITEFKIVEAAAIRCSRPSARRRQTLSSFSALIDYCRIAMAKLEREQFRILFLDRKNGLIADEVQGEGTVDHAPVYPREIMRRALELGASALILVHNHPSGDPTPSREDIAMTQQIAALGKGLEISVHDHLIIGRQGHVSLKSLQLF